MTCKKMIEIIFATGLFSTTWKLLMVMNCWISGLISLDDAQALFAECGFTFTKPTTTGETILTNGTQTPTTYTIVSLITAYHDNDYAKSSAIAREILRLIETLQKAGYLLTSEQTSLEALAW